MTHSEGANVAVDSGVLCNAIDDPIQHFRGHVIQHSVDRAVMEAKLRRKHLGGTESVNISATASIRHNLNSEDRRIMLGVLSGAIWSPDVLCSAG